MKYSIVNLLCESCLYFTLLSSLGCSLAMKYEQAEMPVPKDFSDSALSQTDTSIDKNEVYIPAKWQTFIVDEQLKKLVQIALDNNRDLRVAALNVEKAQAQYRIEKSNTLPELALQGSGQHRGSSENIAGGGTVSHEYQANLGVAAYELDFFARVHNLGQVALQNYLATEEAKNSAQISLVAEVSSYYINYQLASAELKLLKENLKSSKELFSLVEKRAALGVDKPEVLQQTAMMYQTARLLVLQKQQEQESIQNGLQFLLAKPIKISGIDFSQPIFMEKLPDNLQSDVLMNRPDIRQAEMMLRKSNANIGIARANFFPRISLTANGGVASNSLSNLFESESEAWLFKPEVYIPLFRGGANKAILKQAKIEQKISVAQYEKSIQLAFREVADALRANTLLEEQKEASKKQLHAAQALYNFAHNRFEQGLDNRMSLLQAYQNVLQAQQQDFLIRRQYSLSRIQLYKALGGGWQEES